MRAQLIRHGKTAGNAERRYIGITDQLLSGQGRAEAELAQKDPARKTVFVSPLIRARESASLLFPNAEQVVLPGLRETDFGVFEGRSADEMADDPVYRAWVDGMCLGRCPGGESRGDVVLRAAEAVIETVRQASADPESEDPLVFVTHGGVIMAVLSALADPPGDYYDFMTPNLCGWEAECVWENEQLLLKNLKQISFIKS
ncbi:MAG: histidine phosphatase family protein [Lachnospiraceae bacterium]|nr:histidine phosphatase family protein [Lachnospiraceae bacterium]MBQ6242576.1 histidine phosphatase family protein [Lachnospiraceae bacterium]